MLLVETSEDMLAIYAIKFQHNGETIAGQIIEDTDIMNELLRINPRVDLEEYGIRNKKLSDFNIELSSTDSNRITEFVECDDRSEYDPVDGISDEIYDAVEESVYKKNK